VRAHVGPEPIPYHHCYRRIGWRYILVLKGGQLIRKRTDGDVDRPREKNEVDS